jgi:ribosome maturation factor RimP
MQLDDRIGNLVRPTIEALGYRLVRIQVSGRQRPRLQVMAERADDQPMMVNDCATLSNAVSAVLDVEDPIVHSYTLEVSSPGIDRPLVQLSDYDRFAGFEARIEMARPIDGRRRFRGRLSGTEGDVVRVTVDGADVMLPFVDIQRAKLVLTDDLLAAHAPSQ